uniref:E3 ubiquitin-protein ligase HERC4 n=1 Tax=Macrostomum lignano TaxID=282301 RepID=A0A1I8F4C2_9PLAT
MTRSRKRAISETENKQQCLHGRQRRWWPSRKTARADTAAAAGASSSGADSAAVDKVRLHFNSTPGQVLTLGEGDTGQLGLGDEVLGRKRPAKVDGLSNVVQAVAGGMHTVCLTADGVVYTFGCNDEQALGRSTSEDGSEYLPGQVGEGLPDPAEDPVVHISAGTATPRQPDPPKEVSARPIQLEFPEPGVRVAKTAPAPAMLDGRVFTLGCGEQGQLGRRERTPGRRSRRPQWYATVSGAREVRIRGSPYFTDVWAGAYVSFAKSAKKGAIFTPGTSTIITSWARAIWRTNSFCVWLPSS